MHVFINLLKNAKEAMQDTPMDNRIIKIIVKAQKTCVVIKVSDTGCGISPENMKKIFTHGFTTKKDGHGFGLHSCLTYVKEMGGDMKIFSEGVSKGTTFTIKLPM